MKVYSVYGCCGRESWHEKTFGDSKHALKFAQKLAEDFFKDRNHQKEPDLKLFGPDTCDGAIGHWGYGYSELSPEPLVSVFEHEVE